MKTLKVFACNDIASVDIAPEPESPEACPAGLLCKKCHEAVMPDDESVFIEFIKVHEPHNDLHVVIEHLGTFFTQGQVMKDEGDVQ